MAWKKYGGGGGDFFKFEEEGDQLIGTWLGSKAGTKYDNRLGRVRTRDGEVVFSLSAALMDLDELQPGTRVKIVFTGWEKTKSGQQFKAFDMFTADEDGDEREQIERGSRDTGKKTRPARDEGDESPKKRRPRDDEEDEAYEDQF